MVGGDNSYKGLNIVYLSVVKKWNHSQWSVAEGWSNYAASFESHRFVGGGGGGGVWGIILNC